MRLKLRETLARSPHLFNSYALLLEVTFVKAFETFAMTCLILAHLMNRVMNCIEVELLGQRCDTFFVLAGSGFGIHTFENIGLGVPNDFAQQFGEFGCMFSLFPCIAFECICNFGITFTIGLTAHCQIHTNFGALSHKVILQTLKNLGINTFGNAYNMFVNKLQIAFLFYDLYEFVSTYLTHRTLCGRSITLMYVSANSTSPLFHSCNPVLELIVVILESSNDSFARQN